MRIAYLVLAHENPAHLRRLVGALASDSAAFFIHVDRKSRLEDFAGVEGAHFVQPRVPVYWGDFSQVEATLVLLRAALDAPRRPDYCVLLSGSDYPLQSAAYIERFFARHAGAEFMNIVSLPCEELGKSMSRLTTYQPRPGEPLSRLVKRVRRLLVRAGLRDTERDYRPHLDGLAPYAGSTWWALSAQACAHVMEFAARERGMVDFFRHTVCPDEMFFQTVLGNSAYRLKMRRNLTYTDWSAGGSSPAVLSQRHLELFAPAGAPLVFDHGYGAGEVLFARKFPPQATELLDRLDVQRSAAPGPLPKSGT